MENIKNINYFEKTKRFSRVSSYLTNGLLTSTYVIILVNAQDFIAKLKSLEGILFS
jgi:hypothetical protein